MAKGIYTGIIEKDENGNFFCGPYLLDYKKVTGAFTAGEKITIKSVVANPSDKSFAAYPQKSSDFAKANNKPGTSKS